MSRTFYLITPCGRQVEEAHATVESVVRVAEQHPSIDFVHYLIFNNGLKPTTAPVDAPPNYQSRISDLGNVGSRARARNVGLDGIAAVEQKNATPGWVCFLDAGDLMLDHGAIDITMADASVETPALVAFSASIVGADIRSTRRPRPLLLRKINNPFLIGATYITTDLATQARFGEGSKEDWKYWLELLETSPAVELRDEIAYEYRVVSTSDHLTRKGRLLRDQYRFFSGYLGYGHGVRTMASMLAHMTIAGSSWVRRSTRFRPSGWRRS